MAQISIIFVCVFVAVISFSEAAHFGFGTQMMPGFPQMGMQGYGNTMMGMTQPPMMLPKPPKMPKMSDMIKLQEKIRLHQLKEQARHHKFMMEQRKLMEQHKLMAAMMASIKPNPVVVVTPPQSHHHSKSSKSSKSKSKSKSKWSKSSKSSSSKESKLLGALKPGQLPTLAAGFPGNNFQSVSSASFPGNNFQSVSSSYSTSSSNVNGVPSASQTGQVTVNDNGKVVTHVF
ncbi:hypothetical protein LSTR_LSTR012366 [Laodelphax striatellus]|uniref:Uncharacterized protein n=1 Tax=Laodelphax striatellus TaxID=195883 RepID=A0A482WLG7_LAOST|nr:hypothetical protein LSTR_LSTR012366 [Laodelphax striatellus]